MREEAWRRGGVEVGMAAPISQNPRLPMAAQGWDHHLIPS